MSDGVQIALIALAGGAIAAIPPTIVALAQLRQGRMIVAKQDENTALTKTAKELTADTHSQNEALLRKTDEIHDLTNSNLSAVIADLKVANDRIAKLEAFIAKGS